MFHSILAWNLSPGPRARFSSNFMKSELMKSLVFFFRFGLIPNQSMVECKFISSPDILPPIFRCVFFKTSSSFSSSWMAPWTLKDDRPFPFRIELPGPPGKLSIDYRESSWVSLFDTMVPVRPFVVKSFYTLVYGAISGTYSPFSRSSFLL